MCLYNQYYGTLFYLKTNRDTWHLKHQCHNIIERTRYRLIKLDSECVGAADGTSRFGTAQQAQPRNRRLTVVELVIVHRARQLNAQRVSIGVDLRLHANSISCPSNPPRKAQPNILLLDLSLLQL